MISRLAIYCPDFYPSQAGYPFAFEYLIRGLKSVSQDINIDVYTPTALGDSDELNIPRVKIIRLVNESTRTVIPFTKALTAAFYRSRSISENHKLVPYDALLLETLEDPFVFLFLPKALKKISLVRMHGAAETELTVWGGHFPTHLNSIQRSLKELYREIKLCAVRFIYKRKLRYITSTCQYYIEFAKKWFINSDDILISDKRFYVVPNAIPVEKLSDQELEDKEKNIENCLRIVTLGRMDRQGVNQKGFEDVLLAIQSLPDHYRAKIHLTVIGQGSERGRLIKLAQEVSGANIEFIEGMSNHDVHRRLMAANCVVLASRYEGMSMFALEALFHGCIVIYTAVGGLVELVDKNGYSVPPGNPKALAIALKSFLRLDQDERRKLYRNSLNLAHHHFTPEKSGKALLDFLTLIKRT